MRGRKQSGNHCIIGGVFLLCFVQTLSVFKCIMWVQTYSKCTETATLQATTGQCMIDLDLAVGGTKWLRSSSGPKQIKNLNGHFSHLCLFFSFRCLSQDWQWLSDTGGEEPKPLPGIPQIKTSLLRDATKWTWLDHITEDKQHFFLMVLDSESKSFLQCSPAEQSQILLSLYFQHIKSPLHKNPLAFFNSYIPWWSQGNMSPCFWWAPAFCWATAPKSPCRLSFWEELKLEWCQPGELPWWQHRWLKWHQAEQG